MKTSNTQAEQALEDMVYQFAYKSDGKGKKPPHMFTGGLSALEHAFRVLGWPDPKPCPDSSCDIQKCQNWPGSGVPFPDGDYLWLCSEHSAMQRLGDTTLINRKKRGRGYDEAEKKKRVERI